MTTSASYIIITFMYYLHTYYSSKEYSSAQPLFFHQSMYHLGSLIQHGLAYSKLYCRLLAKRENLVIVVCQILSTKLSCTKHL